MNKLISLLILVTLSACGGIAAGGTYQSTTPSTLSQEQLEAALSVAIAVANTTRDPRLHNHSEADLDGYVVFTMPTHGFEYGKLMVTGWTNCNSRTMVIGTPPSGLWSNSSLVHEFFHAFQKCESTAPTDITCDNDHSNWQRDGLYDAILEERRRPSLK